MKNGAHVAARRAADEETSKPIAQLPFTVQSVQRVDFGSKQAVATVQVLGFGLVELDLFRPETKASFVAARSIRSKYSGQYERVVTLDRKFAEALLVALEARLEFEERRRA